MALVTDRWYCTLDALRAEIGDETTDNDARLGRYIAQASRWLEDYTERTFYPVSETKHFDAPCRDTDRLFLEYADLLTVDTLTDGEGAIASGNYWLYPLNLTPAHSIVLDTTALGRGFRYASTPQRAIAVAGQWGWCADYISTGHVLGAAISTTTATRIDVGGTAEVGMMLLVDDEAMHVSAVSGAIATVQRGALGTTAATHSSGASVWMYRPPADVALAVSVLAASYNNTRAAGGIKSERIEDYSITYATGGDESVPPVTLTVAKRYRRIGP